MEKITNDQRDRAYAAATEQQKYLYSAPASGLLLWSIAEKHNLTEDKTYTDFVILVGDVILNLRNRSDFPAALTETIGISTEQAIKITGDLIDFIDHPEKTDSSEGLASDIAETEATLKAIPHIRTMAEDMNRSQPARENTYSSTQEAILKEGRAAA